MANDEVKAQDAASAREAVLRILASTPTIIATFQRFRQGQDYLAAERGLSTAAAFLGMLNGERPVPSPSASSIAASCCTPSTP